MTYCVQARYILKLSFVGLYQERCLLHSIRFGELPSRTTLSRTDFELWLPTKKQPRIRVVSNRSSRCSMMFGMEDKRDPVDLQPEDWFAPSSPIGHDILRPSQIHLETVVGGTLPGTLPLALYKIWRTSKQDNIIQNRL